MGVLIKGLTKPSHCDVCIFNIDGCCIINRELEPDDELTHSCPLIGVPTPHGRLIDADEFDERIRQAGGMCEEELTEDFKDGVQTVLAMLKTQTTIIPAEEGE